MLGMLKYPNDFQATQGLNQLWFKDTATTASSVNNYGFKVQQTYIVQKPGAKGTFSFIVPLKHIFGFCEDYDRIVYGLKHTLTLFQKSDDDAIFRANAAADGKVNLEKISWFVPHVVPSDMERMQLYKSIESNVSVPVAYRARQCDTITVPQSTSFSWRLSVKSSPEKLRYIIVAFQTEKDGGQERNPSIFNNCNLKNLCIMLNQD